MDDRTRLAEVLGVDVRFEPHQELAANIQHRTLDHGWLLNHQSKRLLLGDVFPLRLRQFATNYIDISILWFD
jgi:hypothetical protein